MTGQRTTAYVPPPLRGEDEVDVFQPPPLHDAFVPAPDTPEAQRSTLAPTPTRVERINDGIEKSVKRAASLLRRQREESTGIEDTPESAPAEIREVQRRKGVSRSITPVDVLVPPKGASFRVITKGTAEPILVAGMDDARRSLLIVNSGQPAIGTQTAIAAADCFIDFSDTMQSDAFWLAPGASIVLPTTSMIWALDNGVITVLSCIRLGVS